MSYRNLSKLALLVFVGGVMTFSCRPASYEIVKPKKGLKVGKNGDPNKPSDPPATNTEPPKDGPVPGNEPPTADVEVIWNGRKVTVVRVNQPTTVRPTWNTVDPDDIGKSACANPGIVKAAYDIGKGEAKPVVERKVGCESLGTPYTFTHVGDYQIDLVVTSNENELAWATTMIHVVDENTPITDDGGFDIEADPLLVGIGQDVTFVGLCTTKKAHKITWDYADQAKGEGKTTKHAYKAKGQYRVHAQCIEERGKTWDAEVTVVVIDKPVDIPGRPTPPPGTGDDSGRPDGPGDDGGPNGPGDDGGDGRPDGPGDDGGPDGPGDDGTDGPGPGQKPNPGQKPPIGKPTQVELPVQIGYW